MNRLLLAALLVTGWFAVGCGGEAAPGPTTPTPPTSPTTSTFASRLTVGGSASRSFTATTTGTVTITLGNAAGLSTVVGLGIGVPNGGVSRCTLSTAVHTTAGTTAQIAATVDPGAYCVVIYDIGTLTAEIDFTVTIVYP